MIRFVMNKNPETYKAFPTLQEQSMNRKPFYATAVVLLTVAGVITKHAWDLTAQGDNTSVYWMVPLIICVAAIVACVGWPETVQSRPRPSSDIEQYPSQRKEPAV